jgi:hypothetical protein
MGGLHDGRDTVAFPLSAISTSLDCEWMGAFGKTDFLSREDIGPLLQV